MGSGTARSCGTPAENLRESLALGARPSTDGLTQPACHCARSTPLQQGSKGFQSPSVLMTVQRSKMLLQVRTVAEISWMATR